MAWLTDRRCRAALAIVLATAFFGHLAYLQFACPFDLTGDEAHYWDWSRQLDLSYYSKGPLVAYIIRASCELLGTSPVSVRLPALLMAAGTSLCTYWLTRKLFGSERLALGAALLNHVVPLFTAGSLLMTIDPPFFLAWALATCLAAKGLLDGRRWVWPVIGVMVGLGFLAKYGMLLWLVSLGVALIMDRQWRKLLRTRWPWVAMAVALVFTTPVLVWNARHGWVSFGHVSHQTGAAGGAFSLREFAAFLAAQVGVLGPVMFGLMVCAVVWAMGKFRVGEYPPNTEARRHGEEHYGSAGSEISDLRLQRAERFLLWMGVPFFLMVLASSLRAKAQGNWAAPAYFTLMILTARFIQTRMADAAAWRWWRIGVWAAVVSGAAMVGIVHNLEPLYPLMARVGLSPRNVDPTSKYKGYARLGREVSTQLETLGDGAFVVCQDYQAAGELAFYLEGQPKTYCAGSYFADPKERRRMTQYDIWPDRALDQEKLIGRNAIYIGYMQPDIKQAFDRVEQRELDIVVRGSKIRTFRIARCTQFRGMHRPDGPAEK